MKVLLLRLAVELFIVAVAFGVVLLAKRLAPNPMKRVGRVWRWVSRRGALSVLVVGLAAAAISVTISLVRPPVPSIHDEFSYLLAADTFAHGRLTNPPHPMWEHFETFHVLQQPTYMSKYPPGQGMVLAVGQVLLGAPVAGLWISTGLAAAAICWMLRGWMPGRWALLGGLLAVFHVGLQRFWGQTFWGGNVALIGGALLYGALPRVLRRPNVRDSVLMALGLLMLANSRPYEGLVASLPVAAALLVGMLNKSRPTLPSAATRFVLPVACVLLVGAAGMLYYNSMVTGSPWTMPHQAYSRAYGRTPTFFWQPPRAEPQYRHAVMDQLHSRTLRRAEACKSLNGFLSLKATGVASVGLFVVGQLSLLFTFALPLLLLPCSLRSHAVRFACAALLLAVAASSLTSYMVFPHYLAAFVPLLLLVVLAGLRRVRIYGRQRHRIGSHLLQVFLLAQVAGFGLAVTPYVLRRQPPAWQDYRQQMLDALEGDSGPHVILVRYGPEHNPDHEWVYNAAHVDGARVVWAREMGAAKDRELLDYFRDRRAWLLLADAKPPRLIPYAKSVGEPQLAHSASGASRGTEAASRPQSN